jgi:hypothetical protein
MITDVMKSFLKENPPVISVVGPKETWRPGVEHADEFLVWNV